MFSNAEAARLAQLTAPAPALTPATPRAVWNRALYAKGPTPDRRNTGEHNRLMRATTLNRAAALMATSWGRFQILGENFATAGFATLQDFINAMYANEGAQLDAVVNYLKNDRRTHRTTGRTMLEAIRVGDWESFARLYNGPAYRENGYADKLRAADK